MIFSYVLSKTKFDSNPGSGINSSDIVAQWKQQILDVNQYGEPLIRFIVTLVISMGAVVKLLYNSFGMTGLPIFLIKGQRSLEDERYQIGRSIEQVREKLRSI